MGQKWCIVQPKERFLLNEIDAQKYLLSVADKYRIPESELEVTRNNLANYEKELEGYYESIEYTSRSK